MNADTSYLAERRAERRRQVRSGLAGVGVLMALGITLLLTYPAPNSVEPSAETRSAAAAADQPGDSTLR